MYAGTRTKPVGTTQPSTYQSASMGRQYSNGNEAARATGTISSTQSRETAQAYGGQRLLMAQNSSSNGTNSSQFKQTPLPSLISNSRTEPEPKQNFYGGVSSSQTNSNTLQLAGRTNLAADLQNKLSLSQAQQQHNLTKSSSLANGGNPLMSQSLKQRQSTEIQYTGLIQAKKDQIRTPAESRGSGVSTYLGQTKDEEEQKIDRRLTQQSQAGSSKIPSHTYQMSAFGDFTHNVKEFNKPPQDKISSQQALSSSLKYLSDGEDSAPGKGNSFVLTLDNFNTDVSQRGKYSHTDSTQMSSSYQKATRLITSVIPCGLRNIGNTCFMNSILQSVFATPYLNEYFLHEFSSEKKLRQTPISQSYYELIRKVKDSNGSSVVTPSDLKNAVSRTVSEFRGYGQQDAQEFMRFLLDRMHDELNRVKQKSPYKEIKFETLSAEKQSEGWHKYYRERDDSIMTDLFEGQLMNKIKCLSCGYETLAFDNFMDLSVEIPRKAVRFLGNINITDCLDKFIEAEKMIDCGYKCSGCKKNVSVEKNLTIYRFPKILVIHLKRFYNSSMRREKLNTTVQFPELLDVRKYAPHSQHPSKKDAVYRLYGISHHSGSLNGGHYIGEVYNFGNKTWYNCNDSIVGRISSADTSSSSAYVLFYAMDAS